MNIGNLVLFNGHAGEAACEPMKNRVLPFDMGIVSNKGETILYFKIIEYGFTLHRGVNFFNGRPGYRLSKLPEFCTYGGYELYKFQPSNREMHLLLAGETIPLDSEYNETINNRSK